MVVDRYVLSFVITGQTGAGDTTAWRSRQVQIKILRVDARQDAAGHAEHIMASREFALSYFNRSRRASL